MATVHKAGTPRKCERATFYQRPDLASRDECDAMIVKHLGMARAVAWKLMERYGLNPDEHDDLAQEGLLWAIEATPKYWRPAEQPFEQVFYWCVSAAIGKYVRLRWAKVRGGHVRRVSLDDARPGHKSLSRRLPAGGMRPDQVAEYREGAREILDARRGRGSLERRLRGRVAAAMLAA